VGVVPEGVGAFVLIVDERMRRVPVLEGTFPADWNVVNLESVIDFGSRFENDGSGCQDIESQKAWGE